MRLGALASAEDIVSLTEEIGFLPFFKNGIPGFSIEESCPPELWFSDTADGPWEWKGPALRTRRVLYGKVFRGRAGYISREMYPDFANLRRDGYDYEGFYEDGRSALKDKQVMDALGNGRLLSKRLKAACGAKGFETVMTRLQMQTFVTESDFVYTLDRKGQPYGWGVAEFAAPETLFGEDFFEKACEVSPEESRRRILNRLKKALPEVSQAEFRALIG